VNYDYDADGRLIQRVETPAGQTPQQQVWQQFVYADGEDGVYADLANTTALTRYLRGPDGQLLGRVDVDPATGLERNYFYATDRLGSVAAVYRADLERLTRVKVAAYRCQPSRKSVLFLG
jgi:hypothetical protein